MEVSKGRLHLLPGLVEELDAHAVELLNALVVAEEERMVTVGLVKSWDG